jgi:hypothetical protein
MWKPKMMKLVDTAVMHERLDGAISLIADWVVRRFMSNLLALDSIRIETVFPSLFILLSYLYHSIILEFYHRLRHIASGEFEVCHCFASNCIGQKDSLRDPISFRVRIVIKNVRMSPWLTNYIHQAWEIFPIHLVMLTVERVSLEIAPLDLLGTPIKLLALKPVLQFEPFYMRQFKGDSSMNDVDKELWIYDSGLPKGIASFNPSTCHENRKVTIWSSMLNVVLSELELEAYDVMITYSDDQTNVHASHKIELEVGSFQRFAQMADFSFNSLMDIWGSVHQVRISSFIETKEEVRTFCPLDFKNDMSVKFELNWRLVHVAQELREPYLAPFFAKAFISEHIHLDLSADVVDIIHDMIKFGFNFQCLKKFHQLRPFHPVKARPSAWWRYATKCVILELRKKSAALGRYSWSQLTDLYHVRKDYVYLHSLQRTLPYFIRNRYFKNDMLRLAHYERKLSDSALATYREQSSPWFFVRSYLSNKLRGLGVHPPRVSKKLVSQREIIELPGIHCELAVDKALMTVGDSVEQLIRIPANGFAFQIICDYSRFEVGGSIDWFDVKVQAAKSTNTLHSMICHDLDSEDEEKFADRQLRLGYGYMETAKGVWLNDELQTFRTSHTSINAIIPPLKLWITSNFVDRLWKFLSREQVHHGEFLRYEVVSYSSEETYAKKAMEVRDQNLKTFRFRNVVNVSVKSIQMTFSEHLLGEGIAASPSVSLVVDSFGVSGGVADESLALAHVKESLSYASEHRINSSTIHDQNDLSRDSESDALARLVYDEDGLTVMYDHVAAFLRSFSVVVCGDSSPQYRYEFISIAPLEGASQVLYLDCFYSVVDRSSQTSNSHLLIHEQCLIPWTASVKISPVSLRACGRIWSSMLLLNRAFYNSVFDDSWLIRSSDSRKESTYSGHRPIFPRQWFNTSDESDVVDVLVADSILSRGAVRKLRNLSVEISSVSILIENSQTGGKDIPQPIFAIDCADLKTRVVWTELSEIDCDLNLKVRLDVFDYKRLVWIPALEPWSFSVSLSQDILHHGELTFTVGEEERLNFNVSKIFVEQACLALKELDDLLEKGSEVVFEMPRRILRNRCGEEIKVWRSNASKCELVSDESETDILMIQEDETLNLEVVSSRKYHSNHQFGAFRALQYFSFQLSDGFSVEHVPVLRGKTLIPLMGSRTGSYAVVSVDYVHRSTVVEVSSQMSVENHCDIPFEALLSSRMNNRLGKMSISQLDTAFVPLEFVNCSVIQFRPLGGSFLKSLEGEPVFGEQISVSAQNANSKVHVLHFGDFKSLSTVKDQQFEGLFSDSGLFDNPLEELNDHGGSGQKSLLGVHFVCEAARIEQKDGFCREMPTSVGDSENNIISLGRFTNILHLVPPFTVQNRTYGSIRYRIFSREKDGSLFLLKESVIKSGKDLDLFFAHRHLLLSIRLRTDAVHGKFEWTTPCDINAAKDMKIRLPILSTPLHSTGEAPRFCFFIHLDTSPRVCGTAGTFLTLYFDYWIVNTMSISLFFRESDPVKKGVLNTKLLPSHETTDLSASIVLPYDKQQNLNVRQLSYGHQDAACEFGLNLASLGWSKRVVLEDVIEKVVDIDCRDNEWLGQSKRIGISVAQASGKFFRTKIVSVFSAICFCNLTSYPISLKQTGHHEFVTIQPQEQYPDFVFGNKSLPRTVRIAFPESKTEGKSGEEKNVERWSGVIDLSSGHWGNFPIFWDGIPDEIPWVEVNFKLRGAVMFVVFSPGDLKFPPIRVDNLSLAQVSISQEAVSDLFLVQPQQSRTFAFREPFQKHTVQIEAMDYRTSLSLSDLGNNVELKLSDFVLTAIVKSDGPIKVLEIKGGINLEVSARQPAIGAISKQLEFLSADFNLLKQRYNRTQQHLNRKASPPATLRVKLIQCRDLFVYPVGKAPDVFCTLKLGKIVVETNHRPKTFHPYWNEEYTFKIASQSSQTLILNFNDGALGTISIPLSSLANDVRVDDWFDLETKRDREFSLPAFCGRVRLQLLKVDGREALVGRNAEEFNRISDVKQKEIQILSNVLDLYNSSENYVPGHDWNVYSQLPRKYSSRVASSGIKHITQVETGRFTISIASIELPTLSSSNKVYKPYVSLQYGSNKPIIISSEASMEKGVCVVNAEVDLAYILESEDGSRGTPIRLAVFHKDEFGSDPFLGECFLYPSDFFDLPEHHGLRQWFDLQALNKDSVGQTIELEFFAETTHTLGHMLVRFEWKEKLLQSAIFNFHASMKIPKIGISIVDEDRRRELLYIALSNFEAAWLESRESSKYWMQINNLQIDNPSPTSPNPVFVTAVRSATKSFSPFFRVSMVRTKVSNLFEFFPHFSISMQELKVRADDKILVELIVFLDEIFQSIVELYWRLPSSVVATLPFFEAPDPNLHASGRLYFSQFDITDLNVNLTFINAGERSPKFRIRLLEVLIHFLSNVDLRDGTIALNKFSFKNSFTSFPDLGALVLSHYTSQVFAAVATIAASTSNLGNPAYFGRAMGDGFHDLIFEPYNSRENFKSFFAGMARGMKSMGLHTVIGISNSLNSVLSKFAGALASWSADERFAEYFQRKMNRLDRGEYSPGEILIQGFKTLGSGFVSGVKGVVVLPADGLKQSGSGGLVKGAFKAVVGLAVKPLAGTVQFFATGSRAMHDAANVAQHGLVEQSIPVRYPRPFQYGNVIGQYDESQALGQYVLLLLNQFTTSDEVLVESVQTDDNYLLLCTLDKIIFVRINVGKRSLLPVSASVVDSFALASVEQCHFEADRIRLKLKSPGKVYLIEVAQNSPLAKVFSQVVNKLLHEVYFKPSVTSSAQEYETLAQETNHQAQASNSMFELRRVQSEIEKLKELIRSSRFAPSMLEFEIVAVKFEESASRRVEPLSIFVTQLADRWGPFQVWTDSALLDFAFDIPFISLSTPIVFSVHKKKGILHNADEAAGTLELTAEKLKLAKIGDSSTHWIDFQIQDEESYSITVCLKVGWKSMQLEFLQKSLKEKSSLENLLTEEVKEVESLDRRFVRLTSQLKLMRSELLVSKGDVMIEFRRMILSGFANKSLQTTRLSATLRSGSRKRGTKVKVHADKAVGSSDSQITWDLKIADCVDSNNLHLKIKLKQVGFPQNAVDVATFELRSQELYKLMETREFEWITLTPKNKYAKKGAICKVEVRSSLMHLGYQERLLEYEALKKRLTEIGEVEYFD